MTHFLFTTIRVNASTAMRVAINTDFIVRIDDIALEQSCILLDDNSTEIALEDFASLTARLPNQSQKTERAALAAHAQPCPARKIQDANGRWIANPARAAWNKARELMP